MAGRRRTRAREGPDLNIYNTLKRLMVAREDGVSPHAAARQLADERIQAVRAGRMKPAGARKKASRNGKAPAK